MKARGQRGAAYLFIDYMPNRDDEKNGVVLSSKVGSFLNSLVDQSIGLDKCRFISIATHNMESWDTKAQNTHLLLRATEVASEIMCSLYIICIGSDAYKFVTENLICLFDAGTEITRDPINKVSIQGNFKYIVQIDSVDAAYYHAPTTTSFMQQIENLSQIEERYKYMHRWVPQYSLIHDWMDFGKIEDQLRNAHSLCIDIEDDDGGIFLMGVGIWCLKPGCIEPEVKIFSFTLNFLHRFYQGSELQREHFLAAFEKGFLGHEAKHDYVTIKKFFPELGERLWIGDDTILMHRLYNETLPHGLQDMAVRYLLAPKWKDEFKSTFVKGHNFRGASYSELLKYNAQDVYYTMKLAQYLKPKLSANEINLYENLLLPGANALSHVEHRGVAINVKYLLAAADKLEADMKTTREQLASMIGYAINPNSPAQVRDLVFGKLGFPQSKKKRTKSGEASTAEEVLDAFAPYSPEVSLILQYRRYSKFYGTYVKGILERLDSNAILHTDYTLHITATGRLSSRDPNLQNIPRMGAVGLRNKEAPINIRPAFKSRSDDYYFVEADYGALELRVAAWLSGDQELLAVLNDPTRDPHRERAAFLFQLPMHEVTKEQRHASKYITFGQLYGRTAAAVLIQLHEMFPDQRLSLKYVEGLLERNNLAYPALTDYLQRMERTVITKQEIEGYNGRKRRWPIINSHNISEVKRQARNFPIQSFASDICLKSLIRLEHLQNTPQWLDKYYCLLTIHDAICAEVHKEHAPDVLRLFEHTMSTIEGGYPQVPVKLPVDINVYDKYWKKKEVKIAF